MPERAITSGEPASEESADIGANGGRVIADLSGSRLSAALAGGLHLAKVSDEELGRGQSDAANRTCPTTTST